MRLQKILYPLLLLLLLHITSCSTYKADSQSISSPDYNKRVEVTGAHYDKVLTPIGVTSMVGGTAAGAYIGYQSDLIKFNSGTQQVTSKVGNAAIGAVVGFGTTYLLNRMVGWGKVNKNVNQAEWVKKTNKNFVLIPNTELLTVIPKNSDNYYQIKNINDANQFASVFRNSPNQDNVFKTGIYNCSRAELPQLINLFPKTASVDLAKDKYIRTSPSYFDIIEATANYPEIKNDYEGCFLEHISKSEDAVDFKKRYTNSTNLLRAYLNAYKSDNQIEDKITALNHSYSQIKNLSIDILQKENSNIQKNYLRSQYLLDTHDDPEYFISIYDNYSALNFPEKKNDLLEFYFRKLDKTKTDGDEILWRFYQLSSDSLYPTIKVSKKELDNIVSTKFKEEVSKSVHILSNYQLTNSNNQWDSWLKAKYTAGLVGEKGAMFIIYGEIANDSKYRIPIEISCSSGLQYDIKATGILKTLGNLAGIQKVTKIAEGTQSASFFIPSFPAHSKRAYALKLDFQNNFQRGGINILDISKVVMTAELRNLTTSTQYNPNAAYISSNILETQESYQKFVKEGLPENDLDDLFRGGDVNAEQWKEEYKRVLELRREAREYARTHPNNNSTFTNENKRNLDDESLKNDGEDNKKVPDHITKYEKENPVPNIKTKKLYNDGDDLLIEFDDGTIVNINIKKNGYYIRTKYEVPYGGHIYKSEDSAISASYYAEKYGFYPVSGRE